LVSFTISKTRVGFLGNLQAFNLSACNRIYFTMHRLSTYTIKSIVVTEIFSEFFGSRCTKAKAVVPKFYLYCKILDCKVDKSRASSLGLLPCGLVESLSAFQTNSPQSNSGER